MSPEILKERVMELFIVNRPVIEMASMLEAIVQDYTRWHDKLIHEIEDVIQLSKQLDIEIDGVKSASTNE